MKHLKKYRIFESLNDLNGIRDVYQDFLDKYYINNEYPGIKDFISLYNSNGLSLGITHNDHFGKGFKVSLDNRALKVGNYKGFDGIRNNEVRSELEKAHNMCMSYFGFKDCLVGSSHIHSGDFSITYFIDDPDYTFEGKPINKDYLYGANAYVRDLPIVGGYVRCGLYGHPNIFDFYQKDHDINGMFALFGSNPSRFYNPISIMSGNDCDQYGHCIANSPIEQWITNVWSDVCDKEDISKGNNKWGMTRGLRDGDITTPEFMDILVDNQDTFKNYKKLPKVYKDRR